MSKLAAKKPVITTAVCLCALVTVLSFLLFKSGAEKAASKKILAEHIAADKAIAVSIYQQTGRKIQGTINGEPFFDEDLNVYRNELRAFVAAYFGRLYNISAMGARFWETKYNGISPREYMTKLAINDLKKNMVIIQQARIRGIDAPAAYCDLEKERTERNAPTDEITYGPKTLASAEFISYRISGITDALKTELLHDELAPTDAQLRAAYKSLPDHLKTVPYRASGIRFTWGESTDWDRRAQYINVSDSDKKYNKEIGAAVENSMRHGLSAQEVVGTLSHLYSGLSQEEFSINSGAVSRAIEYDEALAEILGVAGKGSFVPAPLDMPALYYVTEKEGGGFYRFEEAPGLGRNKLINDQFDLFLSQKINEARVTLFTDKDYFF